jgi:hypothetical protein
VRLSAAPDLGNLHGRELCHRTTAYVLGVGDDLQMVKIDAITYFTAMVELHALRDRAVDSFPEHSMGRFTVEQSVSLLVPSTLPDQTRSCIAAILGDWLDKKVTILMSWQKSNWTPLDVTQSRLGHRRNARGLAATALT